MQNFLKLFCDAVSATSAFNLKLCHMFIYRIRNNDTNGWFRSQELQLKLLKKQLKKMKTTTKQIMQYRSAQITSSTLFGQHLNSLGFCKAETQDKWDLVKFYVVSKRTKVTPVPRAPHHKVCFPQTQPESGVERSSSLQSSLAAQYWAQLQADAALHALIRSL